MQTDVKVFTPELLVEIFPGLKVKGNPTKTSATYSVNTNVLNGEDVIKLARVYLEYPGIDLFMSRYGKGITIKITVHPDGYKSDKPRIFKISSM